MPGQDCAQHKEFIDRLAVILAEQGASLRLACYLRCYRGARFDAKMRTSPPTVFTNADCDAVRYLSVSVLPLTRAWLTSDAGELLAEVPADLDLWAVRPDQFETILGPGSPSLQLWQRIKHLQVGRRRAGTAVTAGKLLHGKRPRLIPLWDSRVRQELRPLPGYFWEAMWCAFRDETIRQALLNLCRDVPDAAALSLLRVADIVVWMRREPPCPCP